MLAYRPSECVYDMMIRPGFQFVRMPTCMFPLVAAIVAAPASAGSSGEALSKAPMANPTPNQHDPLPLSAEQRSYLAGFGWEERLGESLGVWVSVDEQQFRVIQNGVILWSAPCSTAERGTGFELDSYKTPLGWHSVRKKIGDNAPLGRVFVGAKSTKKVWKPGDPIEKDLVLTRILWLSGDEPGKNKGGRVDSYTRRIYIHGTNDEARIGKPVSMGCIRLRNEDVIRAYDLVPEGTKVLITEREAPPGGDEHF